MKTFAFLDENQKVISNNAFDDENEEVLNQVKEHFNANSYIETTEMLVNIGDTWTGTKFIPISPYPSWIWDDELNIYKAPIKRPLDEEDYAWDEESQSWLLLPPPA